MRSTRPIRMKKPARAKKIGKTDPKPRWWTSPAIITTAIVVLIGAAMLVAGSQSAPDATTAASASASAANVSTRAAERAADRAEAKRLGMPVDSTPASARARTTTPVAHADDPDPASADSRSPATAPPVTITGCLERDDEMFRLKDASGAGVPKARSWKSGFLKKSTPSIEVFDSANRLPSHVGERVSITGTLLDRRITVRSLQRVAASCDKSKTKA